MVENFVIVMHMRDVVTGRKYQNYIGPFPSMEKVKEYKEKHDFLSDENYVGNETRRMIEPGNDYR